MNANKNHTRIPDAAGTLRRTRIKRLKHAALLLSLVLLAGVVISGSFAYLKAQSGAVKNEFKPSKVEDEINEDFNGTVKKNVNVKNTGDVPAYLRVKLVTYRVDDENEHIGGTAAIPDFNPGNGWVKHGDYYYYTLPVEAGGSPANPLIGEPGIELKTYTEEEGGGHQVIEVLAEAIQAAPSDALQEAWGVTITPGNVAAYTEGGGE